MIGKDLTGSINCFGSAKSEYKGRDFACEERMDMTIRKEIIFAFEDASEANKLGSPLIREYQSNTPEVGYNQWPKLKG
ncbi:MAG: hypothetical protein V7677_19840 [Motiliproteus sp.]